eukprot:12716132-Prorocentrum_lima.AAC.1
MPTLEDKVARIDTTLISEMEEHIRNGHIPKRKDCPIGQQAQGPVVRHYQHPARTLGNRSSWTQICADHGPQ